MKRPVMLGPSPLARGGMATVIDTMLRHGYGEHGRFIATHVDGGPLRKAGRALAALLQLLLLLSMNEVSLLHVHVASGASFWRKSLFIGAARLFRVPVLFHLHGGEFRGFLEQRLSGWRQRLAYRIVGASTAAFALTRESAAWLRERCGVARVEVFANPIAIPGRGRAPRRPGSDVLFIGRLEEKKGVFNLLHCFPAVLAGRPDARLVLAGEGDREAVLALAGRLGIAHRVHLAGWIDAASRADLLAAAAVFVLSSWHEQMPMVVLESMAAGTPVVATAVGAVPEMLLHGAAGKVIPPNDIASLSAAILCIMDDNILADMYSMSGLERIRSEYMVESVLLRLRRRYEELAA